VKAGVLFEIGLLEDEKVIRFWGNKRVIVGIIVVLLLMCVVNAWSAQYDVL
jgi:hypothetical protein